MEVTNIYNILKKQPLNPHLGMKYSEKVLVKQKNIGLPTLRKPEFFKMSQNEFFLDLYFRKSLWIGAEKRLQSIDGSCIET